MSWSTKDFRNILDEYEKLYIKEKDPFTKEKYLKLMSHLRRETAIEELTKFERNKYLSEGDNISNSELDVTLNLEKGTCFGELINNFYDVTYYDLYYPSIEEFKNKLNKLLKYKQFEFNQESKLHLSNDELVDVIHDMFKNTTKEIYSIYLNFDKEKEKCLRFDPTMDADDGSSFAFPIVNKRFIEVGTYGNSEDSLCTFAHEFGHYIGSVLNEDRNLDDEKIVEIESIFFELVGLDYFAKIFNNDYFTETMKDRLYDYYKGAKNVIAMRDVSLETFDKLTTVSNPYDYYSCLADNNIDYNDIDFPEKIKYLMGYITAVELFEIYKQDKELAIDVLKKVICRDKTKTEFHRITDNIELNKNLDNHVKRLSL